MACVSAVKWRELEGDIRVNATVITRELVRCDQLCSRNLFLNLLNIPLDKINLLKALVTSAPKRSD